MRPTYQRVLGLILGTILFVSLTASVSIASEVFVVSSSQNGDPNYMSDDDGTFTGQEILQRPGVINIFGHVPFSYGNGLGDFDNDGDLDYIMGIGYNRGDVYIYEKTDSGNQFADPLSVASWGIPGPGRFAMDMAVADFNEDGNADFVLSLDFSTDSGLYLGDGNFGFQSVSLPQTAAFNSAGADAADFNNDGHADFVIAPASNAPFYVSLGDGQGNFITHSFNSYDSGAVYGVAAADFTGDGNVDIAAAFYDYLYVYEGAGDGRTFSYLDSYELPINKSAIDNIDFDGDENQDLVIASYDTGKAGVAVFLGNGDGTFTWSNTYLGGTPMERTALSGPPYQLQSNQEPVAVIEPAFLQITAGEEILFDGSYSYDEDGNIVSYEWDFGEGNTAAEVQSMASAAAPMMLSAEIPAMAPTSEPDSKVAGINPSYIYYKSGVYTVTLIVTDDKGAKNSVRAEVQVDAVPVKVKFSPRKLNLRRRGKSVLATIKLPDGYDAASIDRTSLRLYVPETESIIAARPYRKRGFLAHYFWRRLQRKWNIVIVKFDHQAVVKAIETPSSRTNLTVQGQMLHNGGQIEFEGSGTIKTYKPRPKRWRWRFFRWW